jgi:hypothetical protein
MAPSDFPTIIKWIPCLSNREDWTPLAEKYFRFLLFWNEKSTDHMPIEECRDECKILERLCIDLAARKIIYKVFRRKAMELDLFFASHAIRSSILSKEEQDQLFATIDPVQAFDPQHALASRDLDMLDLVESIVCVK